MIGGVFIIHPRFATILRSIAAYFAAFDDTVENLEAEYS